MFVAICIVVIFAITALTAMCCMMAFGVAKAIAIKAGIAVALTYTVSRCFEHAGNIRNVKGASFWR